MIKFRTALVPALALTLSFSAVAKTYNLQPAGPSSAPAVEREDSQSSEEKVLHVRFNLKRLDTTDTTIGTDAFQKIAVDQLALTSEVGAPQLPFYAITLAVAPEKVAVEVEPGSPFAIDGLKAFPAQQQKCRCDDPARNNAAPRFDAATYHAPVGYYRVDRLGDFRGKPVTRVLLFPQQYDTQASRLTAFPTADFRIHLKDAAANDLDKAVLEHSSDKDDPAASAYDYLVVAPKAFMPSLESWVNWKSTTRKLRFKMLALEEAGSTPEEISAKIHAEYATAKFTYGLIVGSQDKVPTFKVETSSDTETPSDLPYWTMGGADDIVPDVYAGRLVVDDTADLERELGKFRAYEEATDASQLGWSRALGIASNEGSSPWSDNQYVLAIQNKIQEAYGTYYGHFYQNNPLSNPDFFNRDLNEGAMWVTYVGHGSGYSWPSFGNDYGVDDIKKLDNADAVKPVWIDVACQNGGLFKGAAGERLMNEVDAKGRAVGVTAYFGGSVNVSWDPPAILARGIAYKMVENDQQRALGALIQAGQAYLSENNSNVDDLKDNQRWYHLQGDPSLQVRLEQ